MSKSIPWRKVLATIVVGAFFLFFWLNGPLQLVEVLAHLEHEETEYSKPIMVGELKESKSFGDIGEVITKGDGWTLIHENSESEKGNFKVLSFEKEELSFSEEYADKLKQHIHLLFDEPIKTSAVATDKLLYLEVNQENQRWFYLESGILTPHIKGYGGPINIGVLIGQNGKIERVQHVSSKETESYLNKIVASGYYQSYVDLPVEDYHDIDAVSGATLTTVAIAEITTEMLSFLGDDFNDNFTSDKLISSFEVKAENTLWWILHVSVIGLMFVYGLQKKYKKSKRDIRILSVFSVAYIGFFMNSSFTYVSFVHPFLGTALSPLIAFYALFSLLGAIWGHNIYCSYVCPFGHAQRLSLQFSNKRFFTPFFISNKWVKRIRMALMVVLLTGILLGLRSWGNFELFPDLFGVEFASAWFLVSIGIILINLKYPFIWCRIACPTGAVLDGVNSLCRK